MTNYINLLNKGLKIMEAKEKLDAKQQKEKDKDKDKKDVYVKAYPGEEKSVMYETKNAEKIFRWSNGTRSWRNNNPGNIRHGEFTKKNGAIGKAGGFACFSDKKAGKNALIALLKTPSYQKGSLRDAIYRYAPPNENNTENYLKHVASELKIEPDTPMSKLSEQQLIKLADLIEKHEGFKEGKIELVEKNKKYIWKTMKDEAVRDSHMAREGKIFSWYKRPEDGHPGEAYNCRCHAEKYKEPKNLEQKDEDEKKIKEIMKSKEYKTDSSVQKFVEDWFKLRYGKKDEKIDTTFNLLSNISSLFG